jgi:1,4-dihydroxy-6-naphthoate synthase
MADTIDKLTVHISPCPNDIFTFAGLILNKVPWDGPTLIFTYQDIENLNQIGLSSQKPDILKCSFALLPKLLETYNLCSTGSALGMGVGPLLIGNKNIAIKDIEKILIPGENTTAALLTKRYLPSIELQPIPYHNIIDKLKDNKNYAGVIIHESRFTYQNHQMEILHDLGASWEKETKLPLPLGGIVLKKNLSTKISQSFTAALKKSLEWSYLNRIELYPLLKDHAQELSTEVINRHIELYVNKFTVDLNDIGEKSIKKLCELSSLDLIK